MILSLPRAIAADLFRPGVTLLGLDLGERTIGLAVASLDVGLATPLRTLRRSRFSVNAEELLKAMAEHGASLIVLGLPLNADGTEGPRAQATRAFAHHLARWTEAPIVLADERYSTVEAEDRLRAAGLSARERRESIDAMAAAVILEDAIASVQGTRAERP